MTIEPNGPDSTVHGAENIDRPGVADHDGFLRRAGGPIQRDLKDRGIGLRTSELLGRDERVHQISQPTTFQLALLLREKIVCNDDHFYVRPQPLQ